jgi:hypothetical protein
LLLVDFTKVFDRAQPLIILKCLIQHNASRQCTLWISNFLFNRLQRVVVQGKLSQWKQVRSGVPQGSVLALVVFALLIDSLAPVCPNTTSVKYADDITFIHNIYTEKEDQLVDEWRHICNWALENELPINFNKTHVLNIIIKKNLQVSTLLKPDKIPLENVSQTKLLGIILQQYEMGPPSQLLYP